MTGTSRLGFGLMRLPLMDRADRRSIDFDCTAELFDLYLEGGGRYFDTACKYHGGESERAVRRCLTDRYPRDRFELTDKLTLDAVKGPEEQEAFFLRQLERCGVEYFDRYLIHSLGPLRWEIAEAWKSFDFLCRIKDKGQALQIGFSYHGDAETLNQILSTHPEVDVVQLQLNYIDWRSPVVQSEACWEAAVRHGKTISVMEPLKGGALAGDGLLPQSCASPAALGLRFAAEKERVDTVLSGMNKPEQVSENLKTFRNLSPLTAEERDWLKRAAALFHSRVAVACSGCGYCLELCPKHIPIPEIFNIYNNYSAVGKENPRNAWIYVKNACAGKGKPSDFLSCGSCERICPQQLPTRTLLQKISRELEQPEK